MARLTALITIAWMWPLLAGCQDGSVDGSDARSGDGGLGDAVVAGQLLPNPAVGIDQLQVKGHQRSDWFPRDNLLIENQREVYRGQARSSLSRQLTHQDVRAYHLGFHLTWQDFRGGARSGYEVGRLESLCAYFADCFARTGEQEPLLDWVGPIFVVFEFHGAPQFDPAEADRYTEGELAHFGYPYENYLYQLDLSTEFLDRERVFTPDDMQGDHPTLRDAVLADGWPTLEELDGKFIFIMKGPPELREAYLGRQWVQRFHFGPDDARFFVAADSPEDDHAAFFSLFGPDEVERVGPLVDQGFIVHGAAEDPASVLGYREAGAHLLTAVHLEETDIAGAGRCNPRTASPECYDAVAHYPSPEVVP